jgi:hypothetical protein
VDYDRARAVGYPTSLAQRAVVAQPAVVVHAVQSLTHRDLHVDSTSRQFLRQPGFVQADSQVARCDPHVAPHDRAGA